MKEIDLSKLLTDTKLINILSNEGKEILLALTTICKHEDKAKDVDDIIIEMNDCLSGKPWLYTIIALFFWIDELLKTNPSNSDNADENDKFKALIDFMEWELKKKASEEDE